MAYDVVDMGADEVLDTTILPVRNVYRDTYWSTIQAAINAAVDGDEIEVSSGTYNEQVTIDCNIIIRSTEPTNEAVVEATIIDGNYAGTVVTFVRHRTTGANLATAKLSGLSIVNGFTQGLDGVPAGICGGTGWLHHRPLPDLLQPAGKAAASATPKPRSRIARSALTRQVSGWTVMGFGGGLTNVPDQLARSSTMGHYWGGGVFLSDVERCVIAGNWAGGGGGGIHALAARFVTVRSWVIVRATGVAAACMRIALLLSSIASCGITALAASMRLGPN